MRRASLTFSSLLAVAAAQEAPDWSALLEAAPAVVEVPAVVDRFPPDLRPWAEGLTAGLTEEDRVALFADGLRTDDLGRAFAAATLLQRAGASLDEASPRALYEEVVACHLIERVARVAAMEGKVARARTPEWLQKAEAPARARGAALLVRLLRRHGADRAAALAVCEAVDLLLPEGEAAAPIERAARRQAVRQLGGEGARISDCLDWFSAELRAREFDAAEAALEAARAASTPYAFDRRERALERLEASSVTLAQVRELAAQAAAGDDSPFLQLQLASKVGAADLDSRARALVDAGYEHALPHTILAMSALLAGRREEARSHTERARALPGADARVGVLLAVLAWPQVQRRLLEAPGEVETELAVERLLGELDEAVAGDPSPAAAALRELRGAGWPEASGKELAVRIAARFGASERAPATSQGYSLALAGVLAGMVDGAGDVDTALRFLSLPFGAALQQRPLLMRQRASVATIAVIWGVMTGGNDDLLARSRALAVQARRDLADLGGETYAGYLGLLERWVAADAAAEQRAVREALAALPVSIVQHGAWLPGSAALVFGAGGVDRDGFVNLRAATGRGRDPMALVPLAVALAASDHASARSMLDYLRSSVKDGRARNLLAVAEIAGGAPEAVAAARARSVLASEDWSESEARELAHGVWMRFQLDWDLGYTSRGPVFTCRLQCEPTLLPKLEVATELRRFARRR
jgi:hypothetical protein